MIRSLPPPSVALAPEKFPRALVLGLLFSVSGCGGLTCGPGTVEVDGSCIVADGGTPTGAGAGGVPNVVLDVVLDGMLVGEIHSLAPFGSIACGDSCSAGFEPGTTVLLEAVPDPLGRVAGWSSNCTQTGNHCLVTLDEPQTVTATFDGYVLDVDVVGTGAGTVSANVGAIQDCAGSCQDAFELGTQVRLTATPDPGASFAGWSGSVCSGLAPVCVVSMDDARSATATFYDHRVVFVTAEEWTCGEIGGVPGGDAKCAASAAAAGLSGTFIAWLSDVETGDVADRFDPSDEYVYVRPDAELIAVGWSDLSDGTIANRNELTADGSLFPITDPPLASSLIWTGTNDDGTMVRTPEGFRRDCVNWADTTIYASAAAARIEMTGPGWSGASGSMGHEVQPLLCFEQ